MRENTGHEELARLGIALAALQARHESTVAELAALRRSLGPLRRRRPRLPWVLGVALLAALVPAVLLAAAPFTDLTGGVHDADIAAIYQAGVTTGCDPTHYCPTATVTRQELASFLARLGGLGDNRPVANARAVQGYPPDGLLRAARGERPSSAIGHPQGDTTFRVVATVRLIAPGPGFVLVAGTASYERFASGNTCRVGYRLRDTAGAGTSAEQYADLGDPSIAAMAGALSYTFQVASAGQQVFVLEARNVGGDAGFVSRDGELTALFVPFGPAGGTTLDLP